MNTRVQRRKNGIANLQEEKLVQAAKNVSFITENKCLKGENCLALHVLKALMADQNGEWAISKSDCHSDSGARL